MEFEYEAPMAGDVRHIVLVVSVELSYNEVRSIKHAAGVVELLLTQTSRGWSHHAVDPAWCRAANERLVELGEAGQPREDDHVLLHRVAATIAATERTGLDMTIADLVAVATRLAPPQPPAPIGPRTRESALAA